MSAKEALLGEYTNVIEDLIAVIETISDETLRKFQDPETKDEDCRSIMAVLTHVVYSGHRYTYYLATYAGETPLHPIRHWRSHTSEYVDDLRSMFDDCKKFLSEHHQLNLLESDPEKKIHVSWGQVFDSEQLMEHAIVHIMRHRRQIEHFLSSPT